MGAQGLQGLRVWRVVFRKSQRDAPLALCMRRLQEYACVTRQAANQPK